MADSKNLRGIVLSTYDYSDSSRIVNLYTLERGRLSFMAKGAKRNKSKFLNLTQAYVEGSFNLVEGKSMYYIKDGLIDNAHLGLRKSIGRLTCASFATELINMVAISQADSDLFYLLSSVLTALEEGLEESLLRIIGAYLFKLASFLGFRPTLASCIVCGKRPEDFALNIPAGGLLCEDHRDSGTRLLSREAYIELTSYIQKPLGEIGQGKSIIDQKKMNILAYSYLQYHLDLNHPKSYSMMQRLGYL